MKKDKKQILIIFISFVLIFYGFLCSPKKILASDDLEKIGSKIYEGAKESWWDSKPKEEQTLWEILSPNLYLLSTDKIGPYEPYVEKHPAVIIARLVGVIFNFLAAIFIVLIVYAGFAWMFAQGNQENITKAKNIMRDAIIGLAIILGAHIISYFIFQNLTATIY